MIMRKGAAGRSKRIFTGGAVTVNGICGDAKGTVAPDGVQQSLKKP